MQLYFFFCQRLLIHEIVVISNQISACSACKSVAYKINVMLFWRNNFLLWALSSTSFGQYFQINVKSGSLGKRHKGFIGSAQFESITMLSIFTTPPAWKIVYFSDW